MLSNHGTNVKSFDYIMVTWTFHLTCYLCQNQYESSEQRYPYLTFKQKKAEKLKFQSFFLSTVS